MAGSLSGDPSAGYAVYWCLVVTQSIHFNVYVHAPEVRRMFWIFGTGVPGGCEPPDVSAGN